MFRKKLSFIIFGLGIVVFALGITLSLLQEFKLNTNSEEKNQIVEEPEVLGFSFRKFEIKKNNNGVTISYILINRKSIVISDLSLKINFFNQNELLDTYDYEIDTIEDESEITVEAELMIEYEKITRCELEFKDKKIEIVPNLGKNYLLIPSSE